jgi:hypothetical protein
VRRMVPVNFNCLCLIIVLFITLSYVILLTDANEFLRKVCVVLNCSPYRISYFALSVNISNVREFAKRLKCLDS